MFLANTSTKNKGAVHPVVVLSLPSHGSVSEFVSFLDRRNLVLCPCLAGSVFAELRGRVLKVPVRQQPTIKAHKTLCPR